MKLYATVQIPTRVSYEEVHDIHYMEEFNISQSLSDIINWAKRTINEKGEEGLGKPKGGVSDVEAFCSIKLSIQS